jgi:hypothetical protein
VRTLPPVTVFLCEIDVSTLIADGYRLPNLAAVSRFTTTGQLPLLAHVFNALVIIIDVCSISKKVFVGLT